MRSLKEIDAELGTLVERELSISDVMGYAFLTLVLVLCISLGAYGIYSSIYSSGYEAGRIQERAMQQSGWSADGTNCISTDNGLSVTCANPLHNHVHDCVTTPEGFLTCQYGGN